MMKTMPFFKKKKFDPMNDIALNERLHILTVSSVMNELFNLKLISVSFKGPCYM